MLLTVLDTDATMVIARLDATDATMVIARLDATDATMVIVNQA